MSAHLAETGTGLRALRRGGGNTPVDRGSPSRSGTSRRWPRVSQGTVSKVLNDAPGVGAETRSRILKLIQDLDYHPDASARSLVARKTGSIGVIIPAHGELLDGQRLLAGPADRDHGQQRRSET